MTNEPVLEVERLTKVFPGPPGSAAHAALDGVSLTLAAGGALAVVGESGSGKTTLARIVVGLERATSGRLVINGREWTGGRTTRAERARRAREAQIVFQDPYSSLDPSQRSADVLREVLDFHFDLSRAESRSRADELLEQVGLSSRVGRALPRDLSGGQRQRLAIARALATQPSLVILDEAVAALDVSIQAQILAVLRDIRAQSDVAYLFISHDLAVVRQISDEVVVMRQGSIVERGRTGEVLDAPHHEYTRLLRSSVPGPGWRPSRTPHRRSTR